MLECQVAAVDVFQSPFIAIKLVQDLKLSTLLAEPVQAAGIIREQHCLCLDVGCASALFDAVGLATCQQLSAAQHLRDSGEHNRGSQATG